MNPDLPSTSSLVEGRVCIALACSHNAIATAAAEVNRSRICGEGGELACVIFLAFERFKRNIIYKDCGIELLFF